MTEEKPRFKLKYINWLLVVLIILINGYVLVAPLLPQLDLKKRQHKVQAVAGLPYKSKTDQSKNNNRQDIPSDNRLVIPKIALDQHIYQGSAVWLLNKGVWARPNTSTPPEGGNTVLTGHRFTYGGPATFYSLDKLAAGDRVVIYWQGKEYDYKVAKTKIVSPSATEIEESTDNTQLTIFTCTPLWTAKNRLVVIAYPDKELN